MKYMCDNLDDKYGILKLQDKILEIMVYIDEFCRENDIEYFLMGGSALGAKRHGGFIPWDDDLDIFMTPDNYEKFRSLFSVKGDKEKYYLQQYGYCDGMVTIPKLRMNNSTYVEEILKDWDIHHGIFVDIFILHTCPNNKVQQLVQCFWAKYIVVKGMALRGYSRRKGFAGLLLKIASLLPEKFLISYALRQVYKYRDLETNYYCNFLGKAVFKKGIYKKEWFIKSIDVKFETIKLRASKNLHEFLVERFGDYMEIPSADRIKWEQHAWKWDVEKDFREYISEVDNFSDEKYLF